MPYKGKKLIVGHRPWWRHPIFPWGWYSLSKDRFDGASPLCVDGYHAPSDGGGGKYEYVVPHHSSGDGGDVIIEPAMTGRDDE
ncbi:hypothetical protein ACPCHQ_11895 [Ralstonia thomasii]|jgi:hypothetical protein|uniref:Uncharacterized protein n=2 Tax=Ralstonia TaxID=48736 RepID=A0ABM9JFR2_9RALS|nr:MULTISPECIES: hypothetical protein [Ralstonia]MBT2177731.1 hypothetical protein [Ralstonia pickettii]CAJ0710576.1 hypothetical protein LMG7143_01629 [Ralstonia sp. LMG 18095]CAJ0792280.1 hypothetical protein LMG18095_02293 [Ralstonia sp. LMG 18095]